MNKQIEIIKNNYKTICLVLLVGLIFLEKVLYFVKLDIGFQFSPSEIFVTIGFIITVINFFKNKMQFNLTKIQKAFILLFIVWIVYALIRLPFAYDSMQAVKEVFKIIFNFAILVFITALITDEKSLIISTKVIRFSLIVLFIVFVVQLITNFAYPFSHYANPEVLKYLADRKKMPVPTTLFANENDLAAVITMGISFVFSKFIFEKNLRKKTFLLIEFCIISFCIFFINSMLSVTAYILMIIVAIIMTLTIREKSKPFSFKRYIQNPSLVIIITIFSIIVKEIVDFIKPFTEIISSNVNQFLFAMKIIKKPFMERITDSKYLEFIGSSDNVNNTIGTLITNNKGTMYTRLNLIYEGFIMFLNSYLFGAGPAGYAYLMSQNKQALEKTNNIINPHNLWIEILSQYGIIIFLPFVVLCIWLVCKLIKSYKTNQSYVYFGMSLMILMFFVCVMSPSSALGISQFWLLLSIAIASTAASNNFEQKNKVEVS